MLKALAPGKIAESVPHFGYDSEQAGVLSDADEAVALRWVPESQLPPPLTAGSKNDALAATARRNAQATGRLVTLTLLLVSRTHRLFRSVFGPI